MCTGWLVSLLVLLLLLLLAGGGCRHAEGHDGLVLQEAGGAEGEGAVLAC
jgi:hypothetical protein